MLVVRKLSVSLGGLSVLADVSLQIERGQIMGVVGESGSGKSMTAMAIMGLLPDHAQVTGSIVFEGQDLAHLPEAALCGLRGRLLAMVFQEPATALNPIMSIGRQVAEGMRRHLRLARGEVEARTRTLLDRVGLPAARFPPSLYPHQLSGGQRQRVMIARALACGPSLLIADEPTSALDVTIQAQIVDLLAELVEETGMALLLITHDLGVVADIAPHCAVMHGGRVVESGLTQTVLARPGHAHTRRLVAASGRGFD